MTAVIVIAIIFAYVTIGGAVGKVCLDRARSSCPYWAATKKARETGRHLYSYERCDSDDHVAPFFMGALWPLALPTIIGVLIGGWATGREDRAARLEKKKEADHKRKMAELEAQRAMTMESVKFLVENGIQADVPGLFDGGPKS